MSGCEEPSLYRLTKVNSPDLEENNAGCVLLSTAVITPHIRESCVNPAIPDTCYLLLSLALVDNTPLELKY